MRKRAVRVSRRQTGCGWCPAAPAGAHAGAFPRFEAARSSRAFAATNAASASATLLNLIEPRAFTWLYVSPPRAASISFMLFS